jgi:K+-transporting ATPase ATPase B chain
MFRGTFINREIILPAAKRTFQMLDPRFLAKNPVMFVVEAGSVITTLIMFHDGAVHDPDFSFTAGITAWLWLTILFANFSEALAEAQGKAQAASLRSSRQDLQARRYSGNTVQFVPGDQLRKGDLVLILPGETVPGDGEIEKGAASLDESAITGESAPVIREAGGDRTGVTAGTKVLAGEITVRISTDPGHTFIDRMIALVEGASRQKSPNEIALTILLVGLTLIFLIVVASLPALASYSGSAQSPTILIALLVCLIPTTIAGLLPAIGIAGIFRAFKANVVAKSGKAIEVAGDVDVLLLDKTGTITFGNRQAFSFHPAGNVTEKTLAEAAWLSSLSDETPEGKSIAELAKNRFALDAPPTGGADVPYSPHTRMSGMDIGTKAIRKGASDAIEAFVGAPLPEDVSRIVAQIGNAGGTPLVVAENRAVLGVVHLKDIVKPGLPERFARLRKMGISSIMITGDNPLTAAAIAKEAGLDDFFAQAKPEEKMNLIRKEQEKGRLVAMSGDGTNDAPSLAQADVALVMNSGTQVAKEAGNMVDLDSDPTKVIEVVEIGKQLLITRGALTTFSVANDVAKYFAILPALFVSAYPSLSVMNIMHLATPKSAVMSAIIFNAVIIPLLIPLALRGVTYRPIGATRLLAVNLLVYGVGGIVAPFVGIKLIDMGLSALRLF